MIDEHLDGEDGYNGISRFTCYKPSYIVDEWEDKKIIREWKILTEKEDYFAFLVYINKIFKEKEQLTHDATVLIHSNQEYREENERLKKENQGLQFKIIDMLDFIQEKGTVTREEIKEWWNKGVKS